MGRHAYCASCGSKHNPGLVYCPTCGCEGARKNPIRSDAFGNQKLAFFDIDDTILDVQERFRSARRAGLTDKDGKALVKKGVGRGRAQKLRDEFLYSDKIMDKDTLIPGAKPFIEALVRDGYQIAYCTARPEKAREATRRQLVNKGLPLFTHANGDELLFLKQKLGQKSALYKRDVMHGLMEQYDVRFVFDDKRETLVEAAGLGIPGVYISVRAYIQYLPRDNPHATFVDDKGYPRYDPDIEPYDTAAHHEDDPSGMGRVLLRKDENSGKPAYIQKTLDVGLPNPIPRPKKEKGKQEPSKKYFDRMMGQLAKEYPNASQRAAVSLTLVEKHYGRDAVKRVTKGWTRKNPHELVCLEHGNVPPHEISQNEYGSLIHTTCGADLKAARVNPPGYREAAGCVVQRGNKFLILRRSPLETSFHGMYELPGGKLEEGETAEEAAKIETKEEAGLDVKIVKKIGEHIDHDAKKVYHGYIGVAKKGQKVKLSEEHDHFKWVTLDEAFAMPRSKLSHHARFLFEQMSIRGNPGNPGKMKKGEKLYKHMNGKDPESIQTETIDIGDVWYQVGEGGCWSIGYMSGKETGRAEQKYVHSFNEETKDGNYPKLYATIPDKGKPMLIIKGGTWKIKTDDQGVAWIYD